MERQPRAPASNPARNSMLRFLRRHVHGYWSALATFLGVGLALAVLLLGGFMAVAGVVLLGWTQAFDEAVLLWLAQYRGPVLDTVMLQTTSLGNGIVLLMLVFVTATTLWLTDHRWSAWLLVTGVIGGKVANALLKLVFARPRPDVVPSLDHVTSLSFPSGHAMSAIIVYGSVAYVVSRLEPTRALRAFTWGLAVLVVLGIGVSRMYLGVHYPSDVLGGFLAGAAWVAFVASSARAARHFQR